MQSIIIIIDEFIDEQIWRITDTFQVQLNTKTVKCGRHHKALQLLTIGPTMFNSARVLVPTLQTFWTWRSWCRCIKNVLRVQRAGCRPTHCHENGLTCIKR